MASGKSEKKKGAGNAFLRFTDPLNMMGLGRQRGSRDGGATAKGIAALQPKAYSDPWGTLNKGVFTPNMSDDQKQSLSTGQAKVNQMIQGIPNQMDADSLFNNPFYETLSSAYKRSLDERLEEDTKELDNNLNARGLIGGSYDAMTRSLMKKDYNKQYLEGEGQARTGSADIYMQAYLNSLNGLDTLQNQLLKQQAFIYKPLDAALGNQTTMNPLQTAQAGLYGNMQNYYLNRPTTADRLWGLAGQGLGVAAAAAGRPMTVGA